MSAIGLHGGLELIPHSTLEVMKNVKKIVLPLFIVLVSWIGASDALAQDGSFTASVETSQIAAGEQFQVTFTFAGSDYNSVRNFKAPDFGQFVVISGPNQSTNMQSMNGKMSASIAYTYMLYARQPGKMTIGSATIEYKDKALKSQPIQVEVTQGKPKQQAQRMQPCRECRRQPPHKSFFG